MRENKDVKLFNPETAISQSKDKASSNISDMAEVDEFTQEQLEKMNVIYGGMKDKTVLNIFRQLRTQLLQISNKNNFLCMISSISSGGGSTYISTNLASAFALDKTKTSVLIDANLYSPELDELVLGETTVGVTDYLSRGNVDVKDIVYATGISRLRVIPIGEHREGAAEYFSSDKMQVFANELRSRYPDRYIFIDSPPVADSPEARILSEIVDLVLLVVPRGGVTQEQIDGAIDIVGRDKLSGLVFNN